MNRYFLTLTCRLKSDIYAKTNSLLYKKDDGEGTARDGYYNLEICKKEIGEFRDETDACISHLIGRRA